MAKVLSNHPCYEREPAGVKLLVGPLEANHFNLSQEPAVIGSSLKSVFKKDYPPWPISGPPASVDRLEPAKLFSTDDRHFNARASETTQAYRGHNAPKPELNNDRSKLAATNFKMDSDDKIPRNLTTQKDHYSPKVPDPHAGKVREPYKSEVLQTTYKNTDVISDYRDRFRAHEVSKPEQVQPGHGRSTILGDDRQHTYSTTHRNNFEPKSVERLPPLPSHAPSNVPWGDQEKVGLGQTVHQMSYPKHQVDPIKLNTKHLQKTNFDHSGVMNDYSTTFKTSYVPLNGTEANWKMSKHRNHDDVPKGNTFYGTTTQKSDYLPNPIDNQPHIKGSNKRTASNVEFGDPEQASQFYSTTMRDQFVAPVLSDLIKTVSNNSKSSLPLDYCDDSFKNGTTYNTDYIEKNQEKLHLNADALNNLRKTHFDAPLSNYREFSTEHKEKFLPQHVNKMQAIDASKLQKSSLPMGSLHKTIVQKDDTTYYTDFKNPIKNKYLC